MVAHVLSFREVVGRVTDTLQVLFAGAVWLVPSATLTVMVAVLLALAVTVTVVPDTLTVATLVLLEEADTAPFPARVTEMVPDMVPVLNARLDLFKLEDPAALPMDQATVFAAVLPSLHW